MADSLMKRLERDGLDVARRFLIERDGGPELEIGDGQLQYLRGELAGLSRAAWYITGERIEDVEARWIAEASLHFTVPVSDAAQGHEQALRTIAFKANELAVDGLMAKGTGSHIRDLALAALGARGDEAIRIIRGDYERTVRT